MVCTLCELGRGLADRGEQGGRPDQQAAGPRCDANRADAVTSRGPGEHRRADRAEREVNGPERRGDPAEQVVGGHLLAQRHRADPADAAAAKVDGGEGGDRRDAAGCAHAADPDPAHPYTAAPPPPAPPPPFSAPIPPAPKPPARRRRATPSGPPTGPAAAIASTRPTVAYDWPRSCLR